MCPCPRRAVPERGCWDSPRAWGGRICYKDDQAIVDQEAKSKFAIYAQLGPPPESATSVK